MAKTQTIRDLMTPNPTALPDTSTVAEAARCMCEADIGDVIVTTQEGYICGIVTDRDIVVRAVAHGLDPNTTRLGDICSKELTTLSPDDSVEYAVELLREKAIRRLPVVEQGCPVGILSIGDLALNRDPTSALADISAAPPNR
jgi:CBS domain-containing protein